MKLPISAATAHHTIAKAKVSDAKSQTNLRPMVSESGANRGMNAVEVIRKAVDSHDAEFDELK